MPAVSESRYLVMAGWQHVPHLDEQTKRELLDSTPPYLREARSQGIPTQGSGAIFPVSEALVSYEKSRHEPFPHWMGRIAGMDFGWDHPTAVVWGAYDTDTDCVWIYDCYRVREATPVVHASAMRTRGAWIPVAWPHDGLQHSKDSGVQLSEQYRREGINMLPNMAQYETVQSVGDSKASRTSVEAGLMDMLDRMQTNRLKVASHLKDWWEEFRMYHRVDGKVVKKMDDLISATRYLVMSLRYAKPLGREVLSFEPGRGVQLSGYQGIESFEPSE